MTYSTVCDRAAKRIQYNNTVCGCRLNIYVQSLRVIWIINSVCTKNGMDFQEKKKLNLKKSNDAFIMYKN